MKNDITESVNALVETIRESRFYEEFHAARERVLEEPGLMEAINEFRQRNFKTQNEANGDEIFEVMSRFEKEYEALRRNTLVEDYLRAELQMCRLAQRITEQILGVLDVDIRDFADTIKW